jgi:Zn-dependent protease
MKCQKCGQETFMPFQCPYCGGLFCSEHRLPESHVCPKIEVAQTQRQQAVGEYIAPKTSNYQYSFTFGQPTRSKGRIYFSPKELKHISVAALLVIGIGFSIGLYGNYLGGFYPQWTMDMMAIFAVIMTASFLTHEIAHKIMGQKTGLWAEFRLTTWGAVLTLVSVFLPFKMISPGAMMLAGQPNSEEIVKISIAGPATNIILSTALLGSGFALISSPYAVVLFFAAYVNAFMAVFNLIPFGILDGFKIFSFNKKLWALAFIPSAILAIFTYWLVFGW